MTKHSTKESLKLITQVIQHQLAAFSTALILSGNPVGLLKVGLHCPEEVFIPNWGSVHVQISVKQIELARALTSILEQIMFETVQTVYVTRTQLA